MSNLNELWDCRVAQLFFSRTPDGLPSSPSMESSETKACCKLHHSVYEQQ